MDSVLDLVGALLVTFGGVAAARLALMRPAVRRRPPQAAAPVLAAPEPASEGSALFPAAMPRYGMLVSVAEAPPARAERLCARLRSAGVAATVAERDAHGLSPVLIFPEDRPRALSVLDVSLS